MIMPRVPQLRPALKKPNAVRRGAWPGLTRRYERPRPRPYGLRLPRTGPPRNTAGQSTSRCLARREITSAVECPNCGSDIRLIAFITEPGPIRKILTHLGEPLEPPPVSPARGPPTNWGELVQIHDNRDVFQASSDELPAINIHSL